MTDYQDALVLENLDLVNWVIRTRISIPNRPLLTYDDFYAIGCEAICRAALKYQPDIYISIDSCRGTVGDMDCLVIDSPEELLDKLLYEMAVDIMEEGGHDLNPVEASALERAEVERRLNVYLEQLPEYQDRISFVFERK